MFDRNPELTAQREALFDVLAQAAYGTFFPHVSLCEILDEDYEDGPIRVAGYHERIREVAARLEREAHRALRVARGKGYWIVKPNEHLHLVRSRQSRARRQMRWGIRVGQAAAKDQLTPEEAKRLDQAVHTMQDTLDIMRRARGHVTRAQTHLDQAKTDLAQTIPQAEEILATFRALQASLGMGGAEESA